MIRFSDAVILAVTKLKTRKVRTIVTATLSSLIFACLVVVFTISKGATDSYSRYSRNSLSDRFLTTVTFFDNYSQIDTTSSEAIAKAKELNKTVVEQKKADAKRLGIEYVPSQDQPVTNQDPSGGKEYLNTNNYAVQQILREIYAVQVSPSEKVKKVADKYNPKQFFTNTLLGDTGNLKIMEGGQEDLKNSKVVSGLDEMYGPNAASTLSYMSQSVVGPFLLDNADLSVASTSSDVVPVIVPFSVAERSVGLKPLPKNASNEERLSRIDEVKVKSLNVNLSVCYRNGASQQAIEQTKLQISDIEKHKADKTYVMPSQIYSLPDSTTCGPAVLTKDTRSAEEKTMTAKRREFDLKYGLETEQVQKKVTLRIVGLSPDAPDYGSMGTLESFASMIGGSSLNGQWVVPSELVSEALHDKIIPQADTGNGMYTPSAGQLVEFSSASDARRFVTEQSCTGMDCGYTKPSISFFGSNSVLLDDLMTYTVQYIGIIGAVLSGIAMIFMVGLVGRVVTDSRRETAVFRAIGAKRNDIRAIYTLYVGVLSLIVAAIAIALGTIGAVVLNSMWSPGATVTARLMFISTHEKDPLNFVGFWPTALLITVGVVLLTGLLAMLIPLARNLTRSPLKDMRDE